MPTQGTCRKSRCWTRLCAGLLAILVTQSGRADPELSGDLTELNLETLMGIEVTSVSKRPQQQHVAPSAVFVITGDDMRRWGVTNIPDALRMVPGLHVARIDANKWAITARGFNSRFANKLLVLLDGRSVYTPLFAGVYWDTLDTPIDDIDRIEVIRGPGGTLWGANAVNGVINIITKSADKTQGTLISAGVGDETRQLTTLRYGGRTPGGVAVRAYAQYRNLDEGYNPDGAHDDAKLGQLGFRSDWAPDTRDQLTLQGDYYDGRSGQQVTIPTDPPPATSTFSQDTEQFGGNLLFRWQRVHSATSDWALQLYYDRVDRDGPVLREDRDTYDIDFDHHYQWGDSHNLLWGIGFRRQADRTPSTSTFELVPTSRDVNLYTAFVQDDITLFPDRLQLTLGSKFEHNDFTGFEYQPDVRLTWTPDAAQSVWAAVSRAVRTPARGEQDVRLRVVPPPGAPAVPVVVMGNQDFESEELLAYELGYRYRSTHRWSSDAAAFVNQYHNLRTLDPEIPPPPDLGLPFRNRMRGAAWGFEWSGQLEVTDAWRLQTAYTYLNVDLQLQDGSRDTVSRSAEHSSPHHQVSLWSAWDLSAAWRFDTTLRYVGKVDAPAPGAKAYLEMDARLAWQPRNGLELSLSGRNLRHKHHQEFQPDFIQTQSTEVERSLFAQMRLQF